MKASILDAAFLQSVSPRAAVAYLRAGGWELQEGEAQHVARYRKRHTDEDFFEIEVPLRTDYGDYWRRVKEAIDTLEVVESRSKLEILADIRRSAFDVVRISVTGG